MINFNFFKLNEHYLINLFPTVIYEFIFLNLRPNHYSDAKFHILY